LAGYKIIRNNEMIEEINDPAVLEYFDDDGLGEGTYEYYVTAVYDFPFGVSEPSNIEIVEIIFPVPVNLHAIYQYPNIIIIWTINSELRYLEHFNVYLDGYFLGTTTSTMFVFFPNALEPGTYIITITAQFTGGYVSEYSEPLLILIPTSSNDLPDLKTQLTGNYPNPFNPSTEIRFSVAQSSSAVELSIFNLKGQKIKTLINEAIPIGNHSVIWNGTDDNDKDVTSGVYLYKMKSGDYRKTRKMILLK
jgi:hypothetical protein